MNKELQEYINQREKEIIKATIEFAKNNEIEYDQLTESMILNGMREISKQIADKLMEEIEELKRHLGVAKMALYEIINKESVPEAAAGGALLIIESREPTEADIAWAEQSIKNYEEKANKQQENNL